jgi:trimeric autotransporter adhesin
VKLQLTNKFLHRVRIHGGEFDSSARAMNRAELGNQFQADLRKFRGSTIERKQMSTKTTFKRVALVAVAALSLGVLSVAPSQAAHIGDALTLTPVTSTIVAGDTATATVNSTFTGVSAGDSITVNAIQLTPATVSGSLKFAIVDSYTSTVTTADGQASISTGVTNSNKVANTNYKLNFVSPTVAGSYVIQVYASVGSGGGTIRSSILTWPVTVTALDVKADATSTSIIARGVSEVGNVDSTTTFTKALTSGGAAVQAATIKLTQKSAIATTTPNESVTVTIAGPGSLSSGPTTTGSATGARAISAKNGDYIHVFNDGSSGVATITMTGATSGAVLATEKVTFFGDAKTVTATVVKPVITTGDVAGTLLVKVKDDAGITVTGLTSLGVVSAATTKIATVYASTATFDETKDGYLVTVKGVAAGSAALTVTTKASATATTGIDAAAAVNVRVGSATPSKVTVTTDKSSYAPGEKATITVVLTDATGLTLADGDYTNIFATGGIVSSYTLGNGSDSITGTSVVGFETEKKDYTVYMPVTEGDVTFKWTVGSNAGFLSTYAGTEATPVTVSVSSAGTAAALDAANEATDAANAATDAALAAADAADAATAAAEDASAAVAKLAKSVNTQLKALKKQLTSLIALVNKLR